MNAAAKVDGFESFVGSALAVARELRKEVFMDVSFQSKSRCF